MLIAARVVLSWASNSATASGESSWRIGESGRTASSISPATCSYAAARRAASCVLVLGGGKRGDSDADAAEEATEEEAAEEAARRFA